MRNYNRKTQKIKEDVLQSAVNDVLINRMSVNSAAQLNGIAQPTLWRYVKKAKYDAEQNIKVKQSGRVPIFNEDEEYALMSYIVKCSNIYHGLSPKQVRILAYDFAKRLDKYVPGWEANKMAGVDWLTAFKKRQNLSLRTPEATSLARAAAFNEANVAQFFQNLESIYIEHQFRPQDIWNMDETGVTTVQRPNKVLARCGVKQIGRVVSGERGELVSMATAVSASGQSIPPFLVFPRVHLKESFTKNAPPGTVAVANRTGWMDATHFLLFLQHFKTQTRASKEHPTLLILDNHVSHMSLDGIEFCVENGIVLLTLPPHTSHKLQPLDISVFGPLKRAINNHCDFWVTNNPGKAMSIYDIPGILGNAIPLAFKSDNIISGFKATGISPFNPLIFNSKDFEPSEVTDRPLDVPVNTEIALNNGQAEGVMQLSTQPSTSKAAGLNTLHLQTGEAAAVRLKEELENIQPLPKAPPRKPSNRGRKRGQTMILTSKEVRDGILLDQTNKKIKLEINESTKPVKLKNPQKGKEKATIRKSKRKV